MRLQYRISLTLLLFSVVVALIFGGVGYITNEKIEEKIWSQMLNAELHFQVERVKGESTVVLEKLPRTKLYAVDPLRSLESIPIELRDLSPGLHDELTLDGIEICVLVKDVGSKRFFLTFDITDLEEEERKAEALAVIVTLLLLAIVVAVSLYLGKWLTTPIYKLASQVSKFSPSVKHTPISPQYSEPEIRKIAEAIDGFFERLELFIRREREFLSMASHEFRTPLTVIAGAGDVLQAMPDLPSAAKRPLERIDRTANELSEMVTVLLALTKEKVSKRESKQYFSLAETLENLIESSRDLIGGKNIVLTVATLEPCNVKAEKVLVRVLLSNLLRNAIEHMVAGSITVSVENNTLYVIDTGSGVPEKVREGVNRATSSDDPAFNLGLGLYIVRRISELYGWKFRLSENSNGGTVASVCFL